MVSATLYPLVVCCPAASVIVSTPQLIPLWVIEVWLPLLLSWPAPVFRTPLSWVCQD
ncbi:hypothetical protein [Xanthomonas albilineans]|uniref:hypothetical protein n=1 Tax=Xanthomonas albilineans TaxID=29447 RepID=UPI0018B0DE0D|nr:hypothetical protein [Xanthomonas albilineans]